MNWIYLAALAPLMFVVYQGILKILPFGISIFLVNAFASLVGAIIMFLIHFLVSSDKTFNFNLKTICLTVLVGAFICFGNFFIIKAYSLGAPQSSFSAIMYPLLIIYATIAGVLVWHEKVNAWQLLGILLSIAGIFFVFYFKDSAQIIK